MESLDGGSREKGMGKWRRPRRKDDYYPMMIPYIDDDTTLWIKKPPETIRVRTNPQGAVTHGGFQDPTRSVQLGRMSPFS